ncbi:MAG: DUF3084 domain-containing protein [Abditibacteriota bacterium]|nr:DUF3084 domain-containing protein [Abditibacteriota bacterium]
MYTAVFFAAMILVSGFVAYVGDYIGRSLGKKRLTMFGLRPKHTAIVSTVITGMIISVLALLVLTGINSQFRQVIFHGQSILKKNEKLSRESAELLVANKALLSEQARLEKDTQATSREYEDIKAHYLTARKNYDSAKAAYAVSAGQVRALKRNIEERRRDLEVLKKQNSSSEKTLKEKEAQLARDEEKLKEMEIQLEDDSSKLRELMLQVQEQQRQKDAAKKELDTAKESLALVQENLRQAEHDLDVAKEAMKEYANLRLSTVVIRQEDEIARGVVDGNKSIPEISASLMQLLANANEICYNIKSYYKGEPISAEGEKAAAGFKSAYVRLVFRDEAGDVYEDNIRVMVMSAAEAIKNKGGDTLVTVSSAGNLTSSELSLIPVEFRLHEQKLIYNMDSLISEITFSGHQSEAEVFTDLYDFYSNTVLTESVNKGAVPAQMSPLFAYYCQKAMKRNPALRLFSSYRETSLTEQVAVILGLMDEIKAASSAVTVRLYAARDLYSSDVVSTRNTRVEVDK